MNARRIAMRCRVLFGWALAALPLTGEGRYFTPLPFPATPAIADACGWIDYDNDGRLDAYVTFFDISPVLYANNGDGTFRALSGTAVPEGVNYSGLAWGDYDNDGKADLFVSSMSGKNILLRNEGAGAFRKAAGAGLNFTPATVSADWFDYDNDGRLDLFIPGCGTGFSPGTGFTNFLFRNAGDGTFRRVMRHPLIDENSSTSCLALGDYDNDGAMDAFMTEWGGDNRLFRNDGDGNFTKIAGTEVASNRAVSITAAWGDYDDDGRLDLFVGNGSTDSGVKQLNRLYHNDGDGSFTRVTKGEIAETAGNSWSCAWGDVNNDGFLDLFVGTVYEKEERLYINNGDGTFTDAHEFGVNDSANGTALGGASFGDYDDDGFLDLLIGDATGARRPAIYHNNGNANHWISVKCEGTLSNRSAIGARVRVKAAIGGRPRWQIRDVTGVQGLRGLNDLRAHFGLADATEADSLVVLFPSGAVTVLTRVPAGRVVTVVESMPERFLKADFAADTLKGKSPLTVRFTDRSVADPANPVTAWSWDFDGDGTADSNDRDPVRVFSADTGAVYSVSLTVSNGSNSRTVLKKNLIRLYPRNSPNVALLAGATASSVESDGYWPCNAVDDDMNTRWSSRFADPQWILIELDSAADVGRVVLKWESAFARKYVVQTALDTASWTTVYTENRGNGQTDDIFFPAVRARFVRLTGTKRSSPYGYSLYEFEVYGPGASGIREPGRVPSGVELNRNYPNPFNPETRIGYRLPGRCMVDLKLFDTLGREVQTLTHGVQDAGPHQVTFNGKGLDSGVYYCRLTAGGAVRTNRMVLIR
jgi:enediyne biosynthesis protein E4